MGLNLVPVYLQRGYDDYQLQRPVMPADPQEAEEVDLLVDANHPRTLGLTPRVPTADDGECARVSRKA